MKRNFFGGPIIQPGDDIAAVFSDQHDTDLETQLTARFLEEDTDAGMGWTCTVSDEDGNEVEIHDFPSKDELITFLTDQGVDVED